MTMIETTTQEGIMTEPLDAQLWDSERRDSPFSTVADPHDDTYCEGCDGEVRYSDMHPNGWCHCDAVAGHGDDEEADLLNARNEWARPELLF